MGCCSGGDSTASEIDGKIKKEQIRDEKERKLLLLGTGASGKSTVFKNIKRIQGEPMLEPRIVYETGNTLRQNLVEFMIKLLMKSRSFYDANEQMHADCLVNEDDVTVLHIE